MFINVDANLLQYIFEQEPLDTQYTLSGMQCWDIFAVDSTRIP